MSKTIYLAARFSRKDELNGYRRILERDGMEITSRWLTGIHEWNGVADETMPHAVSQQFANDDLEDIERAGLFCYFADPPDNRGTRGGKDFELGYAYNAGIPCIVVGHRSHVFTHLRDMVFCECFDAARAYLTGLRIGSDGKVRIAA